MFSILVVCTGNLCRSPIIEHVLRSRLSGLPISVASAGTGALVGAPMPREAVDWSIRLGGDPSHHVPRQLTEDALRDADLVLAAAREHRSAAASLHPRANRRVFAVRQFARLSAPLTDADLEAELRAVDPVERLRELVELVAGRRGIAEVPADAADDDIVDPYRREPEVYEQAVSELVPAVDEIVRVFSSAFHAQHQRLQGGT